MKLLTAALAAGLIDAICWVAAHIWLTTGGYLYEFRLWVNIAELVMSATFLLLISLALFRVVRRRYREINPGEVKE